MQIDLFDATTADVLKAGSYAEFKQRLIASKCAKCEELCSNRRNIVVDRGNPKAEIVGIGEAPGENEDIQGAGFVGRAGQLLDKIMASIGIDTNRQMLLLNVVKCKPPENRVPKPSEAENCFPYLEWQLKFVKPKAVLLFGATAAKYFLKSKKNASMKDRVGQFFDVESFPGMKFMLLYHPAYILRDPRKKPDMWSHVKGLKAYLDTVKN